MSDLVMGGANGPSRAFSRDSGRGGAGNVSVEEVCIKGKTGLTWSMHDLPYSRLGSRRCSLSIL